MADLHIRALEWKRVVAWLMIALCGCSGGSKTYPVQGKLIFDKGDIKLLSGSVLICQQQQEPFLQAYGEIRADGSFQLKTRFQGEGPAPFLAIIGPGSSYRLTMAARNAWRASLASIAAT